MSQDQDKQDAVNQVIQDALTTGIGISRVDLDSFTLRIPSVDEMRAQALEVRQRLQEEVKELAERITKLDYFLHTRQIQHLPETQRVLMHEQRGHMKAYLGTLAARLALLEAGE